MYTRVSRGFTLIELLVVISIIGLLASIVFAALANAKAKARDATRFETLHTLQTALELYNNSVGTYPTTSNGWWATCAAFGSHALTGSSGYIPNLAPTYIATLPVDPSGGGGVVNCNTYLYRSDSIDYMLLSYFAVETYGSSNNPEKRPALPSEPDFAIYTSGASAW